MGRVPARSAAESQRCPGRKSSIYGLKDARLIWGCGFSMVVLTLLAARASSWCPEGRVEAQANKTQGRELPGAGDGQCRWEKGDHTAQPQTDCHPPETTATTSVPTISHL